MYKKGRVNSNSRIISTDEDPSLRIESFLNQWKLKRSLILFFEDIFYKAGGALN